MVNLTPKDIQALCDLSKLTELDNWYTKLGQWESDGFSTTKEVLNKFREDIYNRMIEIGEGE